MAIGGFHRMHLSPTLAQFQAYVAKGKIHYYLSGGSGGGFPPGGNSSTSHSSAIATWVSSHYTAKTVDGVTVYDLTAPSEPRGRHRRPRGRQLPPRGRRRCGHVANGAVLADRPGQGEQRRPTPVGVSRAVSSNPNRR